MRTERDKILLVNGARQVGKSFLIRYVGKRLYKNYVEIKLKEYKETKKVFADVRSTGDLYMQLRNYGVRLGDTIYTKVSDTFV